MILAQIKLWPLDPVVATLVTTYDNGISKNVSASGIYTIEATEHETSEVPSQDVGVSHRLT